MTKKEIKFIHWKNSEKPRRREFLRLFAWGINWGWVYEILRLHFVPLRMKNELLFLSKFRSTLFKGLWGVGAKPQGLLSFVFCLLPFPSSACTARQNKTAVFNRQSYFLGKRFSSELRHKYR